MATKAMQRFRESVGLEPETENSSESENIPSPQEPSSPSPGDSSSSPPIPIEQVAADAQAAKMPETPVVQAAPPESPATSAPETPPAPNFVSELQALGFADVADETAGQRALLERFRQQQAEQEEIRRRYREVESLAHYGQHYLALQAQQAQPKAAEPPKEEPKTWYQAPKVNRDLVSRYLSVNADNQEVWAPNTPAEVRANYEANEARRAEFLTKFAVAPDEALQPFEEHLERKFRSIVEEVYTSKTREYEQATIANQVIQSFPNWFETDPLTQQTRYSPEGQLATQYIQHAYDLGVTDDREALNYALGQMALLQMQMQQQPQQTMSQPLATATPQPAQAIEQAKARVLQKAKAIPSRNGVQPPAETGRTIPDSRQSPGQRLFARLEGVA